MLNFSIYNEIKKRMLNMASLTPKLMQTSGAFSNACYDYMKDFLEFAEMHNLYFASDIALAINKILTYKPEKAEAGTRHNVRKEKDAFAAKCLNDLHDIIKQFIEKYYNTFEECENIWRQVIARAIAKGYGKMLIESQEKIEAVVNIIVKDDEFLPYYSHILGLAGIYNAKAILDTVFPQLGI